MPHVTADESHRKPEISVIVPVFNEENQIGLFYESLKAVLQKSSKSFEVVFVDDGSKDETWAVIKALSEEDSHVKAIRLFANVGKEIALTAGFQFAKGRAHIPMDVDFQDPIDLVPALINRWRAGAKHVVAMRSTRDESLGRKLAAGLFYTAISWLTKGSAIRNVGDFRLIDASITDRLLSLPERRRFNKALFSFVAPEMEVISYSRPRGIRKSGSRQSLSKLLDLTFMALSGNSERAIRVVFSFGIISVFFTFFLAVLVIILRVVGIIAVPGQATVILVGVTLLGFQMLVLGALGLILIEVLYEVRSRPLYWVEEFKGRRR